MRELGEFEIGYVGGNAGAAAIRDQRGFRQRLEPDMAFGALRRSLGRAAFREDAELAAGATHRPHHQHQRHRAERDDQHAAGRADRLAPGDRHAGCPAGNDERRPEGELDPVEPLARSRIRRLDLFVVVVIVRFTHGRSSAVWSGSIGVIRDPAS